MSSNGRTHQRRSGVDAARHLAAQARSGLSVSAYCRRAGISESSYYYWRQRERERKAGTPPTTAQAPSFLELVGRPRQSAGYRVELRNGTVVEVPSGFRSDELRRLVHIVAEQRQC